ncbi:hypothetical protein MKEN_01189300 [Mycena kentingensis (nom. inval.)]|nr:hypothetical protein MKEN_01189300 [Mycena kentingensis (nom. inval.)]
MPTFTPTTPVNMDNERDWAPNLGALDWDSTQIVFTKRTLLEFLKYTGTTVDTNFQNIKLLPKYVKFGKLSEEDPPAATESSSTATASEPASDFKPTRRVRELPGGARTNIFADEDVEDALSAAPAVSAQPEPADQPTSDFKPTRRVRDLPGGARTDIFGTDEAETPAPAKTEHPAAEETAIPPTSDFKPSRRVREGPGGNSSVASFWGDEPEEFKPTRRVRQAPGGVTSSIF